MRLWRLGFVLIFLFCTHGSAQDYAYQAEVFGGGGWASFDEGFFAVRVGAPVFHGGIGVRPFRRFGFEFDVNVLPYEKKDVFRGDSLKSTASFFSGNIVYHILSGRIQPVLLIGGGVKHSSKRTVGSTTYRGENDAALHLGAGAKIFLNQHVSLRPEFHTFVTERVSSLAGASLAIGFHW